jgi:hypothetical protein
MSQIEMPKLQPTPIETKLKSGFAQYRAWMSNRKWVVIENYEYTLNTGEVAVIPEGFRFDGTSIPRIMQGFLSPVGILLIPALLHDFGYRYDYLWIKGSTPGEVKKAYQGNGQVHWDQLIKDTALEVNGIRAVAKSTHFVLTLAGGPAWRKNRRANEADIIPNGYTVSA